MSDTPEREFVKLMDVHPQNLIDSVTTTAIAEITSRNHPECDSHCIDNAGDMSLSSLCVLSLGVIRYINLIVASDTNAPVKGAEYIRACTAVVTENASVTRSADRMIQFEEQSLIADLFRLLPIMMVLFQFVRVQTRAQWTLMSKNSSCIGVSQVYLDAVPVNQRSRHRVSRKPRSMRVLGAQPEAPASNSLPKSAPSSQLGGGGTPEPLKRRPGVRSGNQMFQSNRLSVEGSPAQSQCSTSASNAPVFNQSVPNGSISLHLSPVSVVKASRSSSQSRDPFLKTVMPG
uniref:Uncharacterized protein n=1 Tax=Ditylenchus dipsaci TaxID=166011 RepID=A0A915DJ01_9BILA